MVQLAPVSLHGKEVVADPTPMGLLGLAIGCAALVPIAFGKSLTPAGLETAAVFCLLFGAGCQFFAGTSTSSTAISTAGPCSSRSPSTG